MSEYVHRDELEVGRWYVVLQGSVQRPMQLRGWMNPTRVVMTTRGGSEREVSILKIIEGWDPVGNQRVLFRKAGEPNKPTLDGFSAHARSSDPETSHAAAKKASRSCGRLAFRILELLADGTPRTDEQLSAELPDVSSDSSIRGRRADLVAHGYVEQHDRNGETENGNASRRWTCTVAGLDALADKLEGVRS